MTGRRARVTGRVQGVGYRYFCLDAAQSRGLSGWVRNKRDGSVELEVYGDERALDLFFTDLKKGPPMSRIDHIDWQPVTPPKDAGHFRIEDTSG
jgi:acylphosphatase